MNDTSDAADKKSAALFHLLPGLRTARLGDDCYLYDAAVTRSPVVHVPTQKVPHRACDVIKRMREQNPQNFPRSLDDIKAVFDDENDRSAIDVLMRRGYLAAYEPPRQTADASDDRSKSAAQDTGSLAALLARAAEVFTATDMRHFFNPPSFFNLPQDIPDEQVEVAIVGVPFASVPHAVGCEGAPLHLRQLSQSLGCWFDVYANGLYTDLAVDGDMPRVLAKGVMLKDYGDLGGGVRTVADLFAAIRKFIDESVVPHGTRPLFVGGDHAVSFPLVDALLRHHPDLCLIHLDAHNDLFYAEGIAYNHASPISNLIAYSNLQDVYSFGLRTSLDPRTANVARIAGEPTLRDRLHLHSIGALKRLLGSRGDLRALLAGIGRRRPCYLTIDVDVVSAGSLANQTSTPGGPGLEWWELFEVVDTAFAELDVIGADVVEINPTRSDRPKDNPAAPIDLLLRLIDGLAHCRRRQRISRFAGADY